MSALYIYIRVQCSAVQNKVEQYCAVYSTYSVQYRQYRKAHTQERDWFGPFSPTHVFKGFVGGATRKLKILKKCFDSALLKPWNKYYKLFIS